MEENYRGLISDNLSLPFRFYGKRKKPQSGHQVTQSIFEPTPPSILK